MQARVVPAAAAGEAAASPQPFAAPSLADLRRDLTGKMQLMDKGQSVEAASHVACDHPGTCRARGRAHACPCPPCAR
jgi:hypothetical protein